MKLLVHPPPASTECLPDYVMRLAHLNGIGSAARIKRATLAALAGKRESFQPEWIWPGRPVADLRAINLHETAPEKRRWREVRFEGRSSIRLYRVRVCPLCLLEKEERSVIWRAAEIEYCSKHGVALVGRCPSCGLLLMSWLGTAVRCRCGYDLRAASPEPAPTERLLVQAVLEKSIFGSYSQADTVFVGRHVESLAAANELGTFLRYATLALLPIERPAQRYKIGERAAWSDIFGFMGPYMHDWPLTFVSDVVKQWCRINELRVDRASFGTPKHRLDMLRTLCRRQPAASPLADISEQIESKIRECRACTDTVPLARRDERWESDQFISAHRAIKHVRLSGFQFRNLIHRGLIPISLGPKVGNHPTHLVDKALLAQLNEFLLRLMTCTEAEAFLDVDRGRMRRLVDSGILDGVWKYKTYRCDMYRVEQLHALVNNLMARAKPMLEAPAGKLIRIPRLPNHGLHNGVVFVDVVRKACNGQIPSYTVDASAQGLSRFAVRVQDIVASGHVINVRRPG